MRIVPQTTLARPASSADLPFIRQVLDAPDNLDKLATYGDDVLLVAMRLDDQMFLVLEDEQQAAAAFVWITGLNGHPDGPKVEEFGAAHPGNGAGGLLFSATVGALRNEGVRRVWLAVAADNASAIRFYARRGFERTALHPQVWRRRKGSVADALIMAASLAEDLPPQ